MEHAGRTPKTATSEARIKNFINYGGVLSLFSRLFKGCVNQSGFGLMSIILASVIIGTTMFPLTKWYISFSEQDGKNQERLLFRTIAQIYIDSIQKMPYGEFETFIKDFEADGTKSETIENGYKINMKLGEKNKYENASCTGNAPETGFQTCQAISLEIKNENDPTQTINVTFHKISQAIPKDKLPKGMLLTYSGTMEDLAKFKKWRIANGSSGTLDLRGRFLLGQGAYSEGSSTINYPIKSVGGAIKISLSVANLPSHRHACGQGIGYVGTYLGTSPGYRGSGCVSAGSWPAGGSQAFSVLPKHYVSRYIMKIE